MNGADFFNNGVFNVDDDDMDNGGEVVDGERLPKDAESATRP